jgi:hypothetical protein
MITRMAGFPLEGPIVVRLDLSVSIAVSRIAAE